jgi:hypothetical protein
MNAARQRRKALRRRIQLRKKKAPKPKPALAKHLVPDKRGLQDVDLLLKSSGSFVRTKIPVAALDSTLRDAAKNGFWLRRQDRALEWHPPNSITAAVIQEEEKDDE